VVSKHGEKMKIEIIEDNGKSMQFLLNDSTVSDANALRRTAINSVPTFAIDKTAFYENTSAMFDEYISHRIGLIPIHTPSKGYGDTDEILFTLEAEGPCTVYSGELKSSDKEVKVANDKIPIIKLAEGQRLRLDGKARLGTALWHAKFQPGIVTYDLKKEGSFEFYVESFGQMPPREIINKACEIIKEQAKQLAKEAKKKA
jgi:DNA-directed RNA polymerase subunit D